MLFELKNYEEALKAFEAALEINSNAVTWHSKGVTLMKIKNC